MIDTLRAALRSLRRSPGFAVVCALSLGVGIAAVTGVFSLVNGLFLRTPPGVADADRLVTVEASVASYPNARDLEEATSDVLDLAAFSDQLLGLEADGRSRQVLGLLVSPGYFRVLGTRPVAGRLLGPDTRGPAVVLSHRAWRDHFGGEPGIVGRSVRVNGTPLTVVGVAEEGFHGSFVGFGFDLWIPMDQASALGAEPHPAARDADRLELVGRMRAGVGPERVRSALASAAAGLRDGFPAVNQELAVTPRAYTGMDEEVQGPARALAAVLLAVALLVLLVAAANVMGLQLARGVRRARDQALRMALGGSGRRVAGLVAAESLIVAAAGGVLGVAAVGWLGASLDDLIPEFPVQLVLEFPVDARVLAAAVAVTLAGGLAAGLLPALRARRRSLRSLVAGGRGMGHAGLRGLRGAVAIQVAVSVALLATAGAFVDTVLRAGARDTGVRTEGVMVAPFLDLSAAGMDADEAPALFDDLRRRLLRESGVEGAALTSRVPMAFTGRSTGRVRVPGSRLSADGEGLEVELTSVTPGFFSTLGIPVLEGGTFPEDRPAGGAQRAVVNRALAERLWGSESPLDRRLELDGELGGRELRVVGVVAGVRADPLGEGGSAPQLYVDLRASPHLRPALLVRGSTPAIAGPVRGAVRESAPGLPAPRLQSLEGFLSVGMVPQRLGARIVGGLGALSLLLAGIGLYAMVAFWVGRREREVGIRMAVGADPAAVVRSVVLRGGRLAAWGAAAGLAAALLLTRVVSGAVRGVSPADPLVLGAVAGVMVLTVLAATALPARRAAAVDPVETLRAE